jgi:hypothetical protein
MAQQHQTQQLQLPQECMHQLLLLLLPLRRQLSVESCQLLLLLVR